MICQPGSRIDDSEELRCAICFDLVVDAVQGNRASVTVHQALCPFVWLFEILHALHLTVQDPLAPAFLHCSISKFDEPPGKILQSLFCAYAPRPCFSRLAVAGSATLPAQRGTYERAGAAVAAVEHALVITLGRGCVISLSLHGCPLCYILEMAAVSAHGASAGANAQWPGSHLAAVLKLSASDALFITTDAWLQFRQYLSSTAVELQLRLVVLVDGYEDYGVETSPATSLHEEAAESAAGSAFGTVVVCTFRSLLSHSVSVPPPSSPPALRPRILIFSSGTTWLPKGIVVPAAECIRTGTEIILIPIFCTKQQTEEPLDHPLEAFRIELNPV
jgi:acyl-CoA synthetase (AMP-forming)/AMP-acid ligase II